jgi:hypothetical protein
MLRVALVVLVCGLALGASAAVAPNDNGTFVDVQGVFPYDTAANEVGPRNSVKHGKGGYVFRTLRRIIVEEKSQEEREGRGMGLFRLKKKLKLPETAIISHSLQRPRSATRAQYYSTRPWSMRQRLVPSAERKKEKAGAEECHFRFPSFEMPLTFLRLHSLVLLLFTD